MLYIYVEFFYKIKFCCMFKNVEYEYDFNMYVLFDSYFSIIYFIFFLSESVDDILS